LNTNEAKDAIKKIDKKIKSLALIFFLRIDINKNKSAVPSSTI
jgi:hypothetical protein